ncbi:PRC-barrel domain-containing protein [Couchioplanes azureus]|uniref:PRC-barrel domain-containing protein n=1 Tax=Couchioplanes caeruleus TaxID=56438 RepID=UPI0016710EC6|nr:PRC-barrel domain-containing protein [Couchioplanes caeruleus]GGQ77762.1 hypothetical protein GCM10010166_54670 [Couchioplanes caeruleus subsp. azureus]
MPDTESAPEDLGAPQSFLVLADGTPVFDRAGDRVGKVAHVLADEREDIFHGLVLETPGGHRYAAADQVDGIYEHGVIVAVSADRLAEPSEEAARRTDSLSDGLRRAWNWLVQPK